MIHSTYPQSIHLFCARVTDKLSEQRLLVRGILGVWSGRVSCLDIATVRKGREMELEWW
jgi:hypothetical protein